MKRKKVLVIYERFNFNKAHLYKDVGMIPHFLSKDFDFDSEIVFYDFDCNKNLNNIENFINLKRIKTNFLNYIPFLKDYINPMLFYIIRNAKKIDLIVLFHLMKCNFFYRFIYKLLNKKGKVYLKLDISINGILHFKKIKERAFNEKNKFNFKDFINYNFINSELKKFDLVSIETKENYLNFKQVFPELNNLLYIPNGFEGVSNFKIRKFEEKENLIITVGRIGSVEKNHELILEAVKDIDLKDWNLLFIGPIENNFHEKIKILNNEKIKYIGNIEDRRLLYDYYNRLKSFFINIANGKFWYSFGRSYLFWKLYNFNKYWNSK